MLASIHSEAENEFLTNFAKDAPAPIGLGKSTVWVFIGLQRSIDSNFRWNDGTSLNFTKWASSNPDDNTAPYVGLITKVNPTEYYTDYYAGSWDDFHGMWGANIPYSIKGICQKYL